MKNLIQILTTVIFISSISVFAQTQNNDELKFNYLNKIIRAEGWEIPNLENEKQKIEGEIQKDGFIVKLTSIKLSRSDILQKLDFYSLNKEDNTLKVSTTECDLRALESHSVNGKVFAYRLACTPFSFGDAVNNGELVGKVKYYQGLSIQYFYFDEDGDGKFETRYVAIEMPKFIPDWVKKSKNI